MTRMNVPAALVVDHKFEYTMTVGRAERDGVLAWLRGRMKSGTNMRVEHRKLELQVVNSRIWYPFPSLGVELGDVGIEDLRRVRVNSCKRKMIKQELTMLSLVV
jgi:hypothetical protein